MPYCPLFPEAVTGCLKVPARAPGTLTDGHTLRERLGTPATATTSVIALSVPVRPVAPHARRRRRRACLPSRPRLRHPPPRRAEPACPWTAGYGIPPHRPAPSPS